MKSIYLLLFFLPCQLFSQLPTATNSIWLKDSSRIDSMPFKNQVYRALMCTPNEYENDTTKKWPLIIFLHGKSLTGNNLDKVKQYGVLYSMITWKKSSFTCCCSPIIKRSMDSRFLG